jgi:hypothetical protein
MQRRGRGEKIRDGRTGHSEETAGRQAAGKQPLGERWIRIRAHLPHQCDRCCRRRGNARRRAGEVRKAPRPRREDCVESANDVRTTSSQRYALSTSQCNVVLREVEADFVEHSSPAQLLVNSTRRNFLTLRGIGRIRMRAGSRTRQPRAWSHLSWRTSSPAA